MQKSLFYRALCDNLDYTPTDSQAEVLLHFAEQLNCNRYNSIFILTGYAGTGKTSIIAALVKTLASLRRKSVLLAPTGRAAKVLSAYSGQKAYTIHKKIYRQRSFKGEEGSFVLDKNLSHDTLFIVDEASMISNITQSGSLFGSGNLLDDLIDYVSSGKNCQLVLVGDTAQLPPIGIDYSPALIREVISSYGFDVEIATLSTIVRQSLTSGILMNATRVRLQIAENNLALPNIDTKNYSDIATIDNSEFIEELSAAYNHCGIENTIVVVNSNRMANRYNQGIRNHILCYEDEISAGDLVMVVKNNYSLFDESDINGVGFIANGDIATIRRIRKYEERYGLHFAEMELYFADYELTVESKVMLDVLHIDSPSLPADRSKELFFAIEADYSHITTRKQRYEAIRKDPYFNALQVKFAYAVTCHKAQGGQWQNVFIDQGMFNKTPITIDYLRWFYTALTRATEQLFLINFPQEYFTEPS